MIGGTALAGGSGTIVGAFLGAGLAELPHVEITFDERATDTSLEELTELVVAEDRNSRRRSRGPD